MRRGIPPIPVVMAIASAWPMAGAARPVAPPPLEVSVSLRGEGLAHLTPPGTRMDCSGGTWTFDWAGRVPGETGSARALLDGDGMFFTEDGRGGWLRPPSLQGSGIRCTVPDGATGRPVLAFEGRLTGHPAPAVDVQVSMARSAPYLRVGVTDVAQCRVSLPQGQAAELPIGFDLRSDAALGPGVARFHRPVRLTEEELERGFSKTWQVSAEGFAPGAAQCLGQTVQGEVSLRYKSAAGDPQIEFNGCLHLAAGESRAVVARGQPEGGRHNFAVSPRPLMDVTPIGAAPNQASVTAQTPGRGEFTATYTAASGKSASKTLPASVVELLGFDAPPVLEIGLIDARGHARPPVTLPFRSRPAAAGDLLVFQPNGANVVSVAIGASAITVQGLKPGTVGIEAKTLCGTRLGPTQAVKVVTCDQDTRDALERARRSARERNEAIARRATELLSDDEFLRVEAEIEADTKNLAVKTAETVVGALSLGRGRRLGTIEERFATRLKDRPLRWVGYSDVKRIQVVSSLYDAYDTYADMSEALDKAMDFAGGSATADEAYRAAVSGVVAGLVKLRDDDRLGLAKSFIEAGMASAKMGRNLGVLAGVAEQLADLDLRHDDVRLEWERVAHLVGRCNNEVDRAEPELLPPPPGDARRPPPRRDPTREADPPRTTPVPVETAPAPTPEPSPGPRPIEDPVKPAPTRIGLPLCRAASGEPAGVAAALRRAQSAYEAQAQRQQRAAREGVQAYRRSLDALREAIQAGPQALRERLPALRRAHDQAFVALATHGEATVAQLVAADACDKDLPQGITDLRKIEWKLGP